MGYTYYKFMVMIPDGVEISFDDVYKQLKAKYEKSMTTTVTHPESNHILIQRDSWSYYLDLSDEAHVIIESKEIAGHFAKHRDDGETIASSKTRIEGYGDADPNMKYFETYISVREVLEEIPHVYHFDSQEDKLWKTGDEYWKD